MEVNNINKIAIVGSKMYTFDCVEDLNRGGYSIDKIITLSPKQAEKHHVSGYFDLSSQANHFNQKAIFLKI